MPVDDHHDQQSRKELRGNSLQEKALIIDRFSDQALREMETALERACQVLGSLGEEHLTRRHIARQILDRAQRGKTSLRSLVEAGQIAATELCATHGV